MNGRLSQGIDLFVVSLAICIIPLSWGRVGRDVVGICVVELGEGDIRDIDRMDVLDGDRVPTGRAARHRP